MKKKQTKKRGQSKKNRPDYLVLFLILVVVTTATYVIFGKKFGIEPTTPVQPKPTPSPQVTLKPKTPKSFSDTAIAEDFQIGGLGMESTAEQISNLFGEPLEIQKSTEPSYHNPDYNMYLQKWIYPDFEVEYINNELKGKPIPETPGNILSITMTTNLYPTARDIRVGDPVEKVFKAYGKVEEEKGKYTYSKDLSFIEFTVSGGKVSQITIGMWFD